VALVVDARPCGPGVAVSQPSEETENAPGDGDAGKGAKEVD
jgi:hypothetical protein